MQLSAMRALVIARAGYDSTDGFATSTVVNGFINAALRQIAMIQDWDWLYGSETITTVANTAAYARHASARKTDRVIDIADGGLLRQINKGAAARYAEGTTHPTTALPRFWYVEAGQLVLIPTPRTVRTYKHVYVGGETSLSSDSSEPTLPDWAIDIAIVKAALMLATRTDNTSQVQLLAQEERDLLEALIGEARRARGHAIPDSRRDWAV